MENTCAAHLSRHKGDSANFALTINVGNPAQRPDLCWLWGKKGPFCSTGYRALNGHLLRKQFSSIERIGQQKYPNCPKCHSNGPQAQKGLKVRSAIRPGVRTRASGPSWPGTSNFSKQIPSSLAAQHPNAAHTAAGRPGMKECFLAS